ncbi:MAG: hypothetical protein ACXABO_11225 [Promethearchaeota archaeon]|jgi:hypothetical protein
MKAKSYKKLNEDEIKGRLSYLNRPSTLKTNALLSGILAIASILLIITILLIFSVLFGGNPNIWYTLELGLMFVFISFILFVASAELYVSAISLNQDDLIKDKEEDIIDNNEVISILLTASQKKERQANIVKNFALLLITVAFLFVLMGGINFIVFFFGIGYLIWKQLNNPKRKRLFNYELKVKGIFVLLFISSLASVITLTVFNFGGWVVGNEWVRSYYYIALHGFQTGMIIFILILFSLYSTVLALVSSGNLSKLNPIKYYKFGGILTAVALVIYIGLFIFLVVMGVGAISWWIGPSFYGSLVSGIANMVLYKIVIKKLKKI